MKTISLLVLFLLSLQLSAQDGSRPANMHMIENSFYENMISPITFSDFTPVYSSPDSTSEVLMTLGFGADLRLTKEGTQENESTMEITRDDGTKFTQKQFKACKWYEIDYVGKNVYVKASDVATHTFRDLKSTVQYFFVTDYSKKHNPYWNGCTIYKFSNDQNRFTDTLVMDYMRGDIVKQLSDSGWKNTDAIFSMVMINAYCGGGETHAIIIDANGQLKQLVTTGAHWEELSADGTTSMVYLPVKFLKEKVLLIAGGDVEHVFDPYTGEMNTFTIPKKIKVPPMELVVRKETVVTGEVDAAGEPLMNPDGTYISTTKETFSYFRWDGVELVPVK